jgi:hypothetical protein
MKVEMEIELLQPWSTFVMKAQLPPWVLEKMIRITDEIVEDRAGKGDDPGAGQMEDQFYIDLKILEREELLEFFLHLCKVYIIQAYCQSMPENKEEWLKEEYFTEMTAMWINSQKDNEYFSDHIHRNCDLSTVMYLKIPEYLPSRKIRNTTGEDGEDGAIIFTNNSSNDKIWGTPKLQIQPQLGEIFIFPGTQNHLVYPFRTADAKGERRSVSFNVKFTSKTEQDELRKY